ncbi:MAG: hypothetical protein ACLP8S_08080 [Solirubrobacteraceae bacterium]
MTRPPLDGLARWAAATTDLDPASSDPVEDAPGNAVIRVGWLRLVGPR